MGPYAAATGSPAEQAQAEGPLVAALRQLFAVVENYPQLRANENFLALQEEPTAPESKIAFARQFYNDRVLRYNTLVQQFPSLLVARMTAHITRPAMIPPASAHSTGALNGEGPVKNRSRLWQTTKDTKDTKPMINWGGHSPEDAMTARSSRLRFV